MLNLERKYIDSVDGAAHQSAVEIIRSLEDLLDRIVTDQCCRDGSDEDYPLSAIEQDDPLICEAMQLLGIDYT